MLETCVSKLGFVFYGLNKLHCIVTLQNFSSKIPLQNFLFQLIGLGIWLNIHWLNSVTVNTPLSKLKAFCSHLTLTRTFPSKSKLCVDRMHNRFSTDVDLVISDEASGKRRNFTFLELFRRRIPFSWDSLTKLLEIIVWTFVSRLGYFPCGLPLYNCNASLSFFRRWGRLSTSHLIPWQC